MASALLAAFRITSEELALIRALQTRRGAEPRLDLAGLSAIYRVVVLARALQLRIPALDLLLRLIPPEADPFRAGGSRSDAPLRRHRARGAGLGLHARSGWPTCSVTNRNRGAIRGRCRRRSRPCSPTSAADSPTRSPKPAIPAEVTGDVLRQKLAMLLDPALLDPAIEVLDPRTPLTLKASGASSSTVTCRRSLRTPPPQPSVCSADRRRSRRLVRRTRRLRPHRPRLSLRRHLPARPRRRTRSTSDGRPTSISCSSTCCRSCGRGSCAAPSCRR